MKKNETPGINFNYIHLVASCVNLIDATAELNYGLAVTKIDRKEISETELVAFIYFDLMKGIKNPPFTFTATYVVSYLRTPDAKLSWEEFNNGFILTHVLPYFREFVTSVTQRLPVPPIYIPPTNIKALLAEYEENEV
jgi:hypothetical protein